jgi:hypothetical protein
MVASVMPWQNYMFVIVKLVNTTMEYDNRSYVWMDINYNFPNVVVVRGVLCTYKKLHNWN